MNPGIPFFIGFFSSFSEAGVGERPMSPEPYHLFRPLSSKTDKKLIFGIQVDASLPKQPLSWDGLPRI